MSGSVRLPSPGDDATPFLLRCYVNAGAFRPLHEFDEPAIVRDEFKMYLWRSATLRDIANLLHMRDPSLSSLNTLHFFRIVHFDGAQGRWVAREAGGNITRVDRKTYEAALDDVDGGADDGEKHDIYRKAVQRVRQRMPDQVDEEAALFTLEKLQWQEGDLLDCMIDTPKTARNGAGHRSDRDTRSQPGRHHNRGSRRI